MAKESEQLLAAEEAVQQLLRNLERLKAEIEGYAKAKLSLEETRVGLQRLTGQIGDLAGRVASVAESLRKIGTPELLSRIDAAKTEAAAASKELGDRIAKDVEYLHATSSRRHRTTVILIIVSIVLGACATVAAILAIRGG